MKEAEPVGLRDRKRLATRERLERAAVDIVAESGLEALTIDAISARADVSPRTFFNYFDSKEDAILGIRLADDIAGRLEETVAALHPASVRDGVLTLVTGLLEEASHDPALKAARHELLARHPELLQRRFSKMGMLFGTLGHAVEELIERLSPGMGTATPATARVALMACGAAVHAAVMELSHGEGGPPDEGAIRARAEELLNETMGLLQ